jgi:hypothetical protein
VSYLTNIDGQLCTLTKDEHDAHVAKRQRPATDRGMRHARHHDDDATDSGLSMSERVVADVRRAAS